MVNKNISSNLKSSFLQKIILILFGISVSLMLLEAGLRAAEFTLQSLQEYRNLNSIRRNGEYRIMCLGESTTAGQYPRFLEEALDCHGIGIKFSVIDKGVAVTDTSFILGQLKNNIEKYYPDLVVAMIGINEGGVHMPVGFSTDSKTLFKSLKVYRLAKLLILHIQIKIREIKTAKQENKSLTTSLKNRQPNCLSVVYKQNIPNIVKTVSVKKEGIKDDNFFNNLGKRLTAQGDIFSAKQAFKKAISLNPYNVDAYFRLASLSDQEMCYSIMREILEKYKGLIENGMLENVQNANVNVRYLCSVVLGKYMYSELEDFCKEMLAKNLMPKDAYIILGLSSLAQNKYSLAEEFFKQAMKLDSCDNRTFDGLAVVYHETGRYDLREQCLRKANELRPFYPTMLVIRNYKKIKDILDTRNIKLVCVQYPMCSVEPLKEIFEGEKNIIFVDNEQVFKRAIKKGFYKDFFRDMFAGDFGHCTDKGNKLLAENIADVIAREVFHK
ncbi:MAG: hypothetical protein ISS47_03685 [Candidatus Omnitrophica bacterium]|nr:hypothetical protein [Candidatus Omnitrophota bacterium]